MIVANKNQIDFQNSKSKLNFESFSSSIKINEKKNNLISIDNTIHTLSINSNQNINANENPTEIKTIEQQNKLELNATKPKSRGRKKKLKSKVLDRSKKLQQQDMIEIKNDHEHWQTKIKKENESQQKNNQDQDQTTIQNFQPEKKIQNNENLMKIESSKLLSIKNENENENKNENENATEDENETASISVNIRRTRQGIQKLIEIETEIRFENNFPIAKIWVRSSLVSSTSSTEQYIYTKEIRPEGSISTLIADDEHSNMNETNINFSMIKVQSNSSDSFDSDPNSISISSIPDPNESKSQKHDPATMLIIRIQRVITMIIYFDENGQLSYSELVEPQYRKISNSNF